ncbi:F-box only protein 36 [Vidua macroura]|uniref:F-box only protein 36 n=1 Tax=Vidua macroura TaxID=187451 RepID=UPI0023A8E5A0|nr:F-box only protein 36 [Vidua macroura]
MILKVSSSLGDSVIIYTKVEEICFPKKYMNFGKECLVPEFWNVLNLCQGNYDFLKQLPVPLLLYIISFLELEDIARLSQVSHRFETLCDSNVLWEALVESLCDTATPEMEEPPQDVGWEPSHTQMSATAPKEVEAPCSEQETN